jgi:hypothetical protein
MDMCLYAPEIIALHTWDCSYDFNGAPIITGYRPREITNQRLVQEMTDKKQGLKEKRIKEDDIFKHITRALQREKLPTDDELDVSF